MLRPLVLQHEARIRRAIPRHPVPEETVREEGGGVPGSEIQRVRASAVTVAEFAAHYPGRTPLQRSSTPRFPRAGPQRSTASPSSTTPSPTTECLQRFRPRSATTGPPACTISPVHLMEAGSTRAPLPRPARVCLQQVPARRPPRHRPVGAVARRCQVEAAHGRRGLHHGRRRRHPCVLGLTPLEASTTLAMSPHPKRRSTASLRARRRRQRRH